VVGRYRSATYAGRRHFVIGLDLCGGMAVHGVAPARPAPATDARAPSPWRVKEEAMDFPDASPGPVPGGEPPGGKSVADLAAIAEDATVVPAALAALVGSARTALRAVEASGVYPPEMAVAAVEATTAVLQRLSAHFEPYVGDYSRAGATSMGRAHESLRQARTALSDARHQLALDTLVAEPTSPTRPGPSLV
jgi:hypothetical protein